VAAGLCVALLGACGGEADAPSTADATRDASAQASAASPVATARLFVPDIGRAALAAVATLDPTPGAALGGVVPATAASTGNNVQVDAARDELYVIAGRSVNVYAGASTLGAAARPARSFAIPAGLRSPRTLFFDGANDVLYVGGDSGDGAGQIVAWSAAHAVRGSAAAPERTLAIAGGVAFFTIDAARQRLYVVNALSGVQVFADVGAADGAVQPATTIPVLGTGLAVDATRDRLYVADAFVGLLLVDQASTAAPVLSATLSIDDARFVAVDAADDKVYVSALGKLYAIDNASALTPATTLAAPAFARSSRSVFGAVATR